MRIANSTIAMQSEHLSMVRTERTQSLRVWVHQQPAPASSASAQAADAKAITSDATDDVSNDPRLMLLKAVLEHLTGKPIKLLRTVRIEALPSGNGAATAQVPEAGFEFHSRTSRQEVEQTAFSAMGQVTTADGRQIDFALNLEMSRSYTEQVDVNVRASNAKRKDPLVINTGGATAQLSTQRMSFDLDADGQKEEVPLLAGGAYLALDLNQNGKIDSGAELFGPTTGMGFSELAKYDSDGNGWIDENDPVFKQLLTWRPASEGDGQLSTLKSQSIGALFLGSQNTSFQLRGPQNQDLGVVRASGIYLSESGQAGSLQQIDLTV